MVEAHSFSGFAAEYSETYLIEEDFSQPLHPTYYIDVVNGD
jgi:hypothetical protein